jgi:basic membrane protein A
MGVCIGLDDTVRDWPKSLSSEQTAGYDPLEIARRAMPACRNGGAAPGGASHPHRVEEIELRIQRAYGAGALLVALSLVLTSCGSVGIATPIEGCGDPNGSGDTKIGGVTDVGQLEDKSFNEAGWCGTIMGADALGGQARVIVTQDVNDYATNIQTFIDNDFSIIVSFGFALGNATTIAAKANPDVQFVGLDQFICITPDGAPDTADVPKCEGDPATLLPNYQGVVFSEQQAGYLAGVLAAQVSESGVIGTVGGIDTIPPVVNYIAGYVNGAKSINPDIEVLVQYASTDITKAFNDPARGKAIAESMIGDGADVIFQVAGLTGQGAIEAACDHDIYGIGVDVDQYESLPENLRPCLLTSAEKKIVDAIAAAIARAADGTSTGGNVFNDASSDPVGIGLAPYHDLANVVTPDMQAAVDAALDAMLGGLDPCEGEGQCSFE